MKRKIIICFMGALLICMFINIQADAKKKIKLNKNNLTMDKGDTYTLKLKGCGKEKCKWSVNKPKIVSVSKKGKVKALNQGKAVVTASLSVKKYKCRIKVTDNKNTDNNSEKNETNNTPTPYDVNNEERVFSNLYIRDIVTGPTGISFHISEGQSDQIHYTLWAGAVTKDVPVTINGQTADVSQLAVGDSLELMHIGSMPASMPSAFVHVKYIKATR